MRSWNVFVFLKVSKKKKHKYLSFIICFLLFIQLTCFSVYCLGFINVFEITKVTKITCLDFDKR